MSRKSKRKRETPRKPAAAAPDRPAPQAHDDGLGKDLADLARWVDGEIRAKRRGTP
jgi:hypothetical protein